MKTKLHLVLIISLSLCFSIAKGQTELVTNGNFETGNLTGWIMNNTGNSVGWTINNGTFIPTGGSVAIPPINGSYDVVSQQFGSGINLLTHPIQLPDNICNITLSWKDRIYNWNSYFEDPAQEFRVSILHGTDAPIVVSSTNPGDPLIQQGPNLRSFDLTSVLKPLEGEVIQIEFVEQDTYWFFNVFLDDVSLLTNIDNEDPVLIPTILPTATSFNSGGWTSNFTGININNTGNTYAFVTPGSTVNLKYNTNMYYTGSYCPGCITQHYVTLQASSLNICNENGGSNGSKDINFTAPSTPGLYYISLASSWWYWCNQFYTMYGPNNADNSLGYIIVGAKTICPIDIVKTTENNLCTATINKGIDVVPFDNCGVKSLVYSLSGDTPGSGTGSLSSYTFNKGVTTVTYLVTDVNSNTYSCSFTVTVNDKQNPTITCPTIAPTLSTGSDDCEVTLAELGTVTANDNCDTDVDIVADVTGPFGPGVHNVIWTATDDAGNKSTCSKTFTVVDDISPEITCPTLASSYDTDAGKCTKSISFEAKASDNCGIKDVKYYIEDVEITLPYDFPFGTSTVKAVATDVNGNSSNCSFDVIIDHITTIVTVSTVPVSQQYSDKVTLTAIITPWDCTLVECEADGTVEFKIGNQVMGEADLMDGVATLEVQLCGDFNESQTLGTFDVSAVYTLGDCDKYLGNVDVCEDCLTIEKEIACADYSGVLFASTPSPSSDKFTVVLAATVREKYSDGNYCDIRKAKVDFYNGTTKLNTTPISVGLVNSDDYTYGTAMFEWTSGLPSVGYNTYEINIKIVGENYEGIDCNGSYTPINVSKPMGEFITGGGYLVLTNSNGIKKGDVGSNNNFGFNVKWNKSLKNLQGNMNTIIRRTEPDGYIHTWQVKGNVMSSLSVNASLKEATFTGKASISDITDETDKPGIVIGSGDGNATIQVIMKDVAEPGKDLDLLGITVWNKTGGVWYSSNWNGSKTVSQPIAKGNLNIQPSVIKTLEVLAPIAIETPINLFDLEVYPNPSSGPVTFNISLPTDSKVVLDIFSITGKKIYSLFEGNLLKGQSAILMDYKLSSGIYIYRLQSEGKIKSGKLIINNQSY